MSHNSAFEFCFVNLTTMENPILLFDGVCNFCDSTINFVIERDKKNLFKYASLQSEPGQELLKKHGLPTEDFDSFVYIENGKAFTKSSAALKVAQNMTGLWPLFYGFMIVPKFLRDAVYTTIAKNRYKWFGKKDECALPSPEVRAKFLA